MKRVYLAAALALSLLASGVLLAQSTVPSPPPPPAATQPHLQTAKLSVEGMWCASCGYIVGQALKKKPGVVDAKVSMRTKTATVLYDPSTIDVAALVAATAEYGFTSRLIAR